ncbi:MAG TPA: signal peptidase I [Waterburya sp.]|jgi:signal peptidase I
MHQRHNQDFNNSPQPTGNNLWIEGCKTVALSLVFAFGFHTLVAESRYVASGSMQPTLEVNDRLLIDKLTYRWSTPKRGDIVVFSPTQKLKEQHVQDTLIKRVIGLPGEKVEIKEGRVYIDNHLLPEKYTAEHLRYQWGPVIVPAHSYLVMGDNRDRSYDGRYWGFVPQANIIGKAVIRFWSPERMGKIDPSPLYPTSERSSP